MHTEDRLVELQMNQGGAFFGSGFLVVKCRIHQFTSLDEFSRIRAKKKLKLCPLYIGLIDFGA